MILETGSWVVYGLASAWGLATADAILKRTFTQLSPYGMSLLRLVYTVPLLSVGWFWVRIPELPAAFFLTVAAALPLEVAANLCYMQALKLAPLSLCAPMLAFTPVFLIGSGWLILGETLTLRGLLGIALITVGSYLLQLPEWRRGWLKPLAALWQQAGSRWMLGAALLYAFTSALGKKAVLLSDPVFFGLFYPTAFGLLLAVASPWTTVRLPALFQLRPWWGLAMGGAMALSILSHFQGISLAPAAYLIAVKRTSMLFSVLYGGLWLAEGHLPARLTGALVMITGVGLLTLGSG